MSSEAMITCNLQIRKGSIIYFSQPSAFAATVTGTKGPTPGAITVSTSGTDVDLSQLTAPGLCRIMNIDTTNFVEYGIWDPDISEFSPLGELLPGESYILRLSRRLGSEFGGGPGTGTSGSGTRLRIRANIASCNVIVEAFES